MDVIEQLDVVMPTVRTQAARVGLEQLGHRTPCVNFEVRDLFDHFIGVGSAVAAQLRGSGDPIDASTLSDRERLDAVQPALDALHEAVKVPGAMERAVTVPFGTVPGEVVARFLTVDMLVHGWDLSQATGQPYEPDEHVVELALQTARELIAPEMRDGDTFAAEVPVAEDAPAIDRLVAFTGRRPG